MPGGALLLDLQFEERPNRGYEGTKGKVGAKLQKLEKTSRQFCIQRCFMFAASALDVQRLFEPHKVIWR